MKNKQAFTLIELLVVVLIIGILAAVAVPQYRKSIDKTRLSNLLESARGIVQAQEIYYLANGKYARFLDELDIAFPASVTNETQQAVEFDNGVRLVLSLGGNGGVDAIAAYDSHLPNGLYLQLSYTHSSWQGAWGCYATKTDAYAIDLCKNITHATAAGSSSGNQYIYYFVK